MSAWLFGGFREYSSWMILTSVRLSHSCMRVAKSGRPNAAAGGGWLCVKGDE